MTTIYPDVDPCEEKNFVEKNRRCKAKISFSPTVELIKKHHLRTRFVSFICDNCHLVSQFKGKYKKPTTRRKIFDPDTEKVLTVCNACGLRMRRAGKISSRRHFCSKVKMSDCEKESYKADCVEFGSSLAKMLNERAAERLACPACISKPCQCIQRYIIGDESSTVPLVLTDCRSDEDLISRAKYLLEVHKKAKYLMEVKHVLGNTLKKANGQLLRRTPAFLEYVLIWRKNLKEKGLCERGVQRVLCYSNNFLHKQLKTSPEQCARVGKKLISPLCELVNVKCCRLRCTRMIEFYKMMVETWRDRALNGQAEARRVLAEMLTPGAGRLNCDCFVQLVTGCSPGLINKVKKQLVTEGIKEPPQHGMKKFWQLKKNRTLSSMNKADTLSEGINSTPNTSFIREEKTVSKDFERKTNLTSQQNNGPKLVHRKPEEGQTTAEVTAVQQNQMQPSEILNQIVLMLNEQDTIQPTLVWTSSGLIVFTNPETQTLAFIED